ncbi:LAMI_0G12266g1_1 [Lachancea mirantina]|uniref:LAMI_0G12266g1_1 n=1 Tax=Lachancea mirantina TaxID=1230905 RepID=A0A1G4KBB5_9SACH|nr:LAMI_0G12266g1_1 [Lachancea mirantina]
MKLPFSGLPKQLWAQNGSTAGRPAADILSVLVAYFGQLYTLDKCFLFTVRSVALLFGGPLGLAVWPNDGDGLRSKNCDTSEQDRDRSRCIGLVAFMLTVGVAVRLECATDKKVPLRGALLGLCACRCTADFCLWAAAFSSGGQMGSGCGVVKVFRTQK